MDMNIKKVKLLTTLKGIEHQWVKGEIVNAPFHPDIQGMINDPRVIEIIERGGIENGRQEEKQEEKVPPEENSKEEVKTKKPAPAFAKRNKK